MATIDEVLRDQARLDASFLATLASIASDTELVEVTPYLAGRCACDHALRLRKHDLEVEPTELTVSCCGRGMRVFRVHVHASAQIPVIDHVRALTRTVGQGQGLSCDCDAMWELIESLQAALDDAPTNQKASLVKRIRAVLAQLSRCGC